MLLLSIERVVALFWAKCTLLWFSSCISGQSLVKLKYADLCDANLMALQHLSFRVKDNTVFICWMLGLNGVN